MSCLPSPAPMAHGAPMSPVPATSAGQPAPARVWLSDEEWQALLWPLGAPGADPSTCPLQQQPSQEGQP